MPPLLTTRRRRAGPWDDYSSGGQQGPSGDPTGDSGGSPPPAPDATEAEDEDDAGAGPPAPAMPDDLYSAVLLLSFVLEGYSGLFQPGGCMTSLAAGPVLVGHFIYPAYVRVRSSCERKSAGRLCCAGAVGVRRAAAQQDPSPPAHSGAAAPLSSSSGAAGIPPNTNCCLLRPPRSYPDCLVPQALKDADACGFVDTERSWLLSRLAHQIVSSPSGGGGGLGLPAGGDATVFGQSGGGGGGDQSPFGDQQQESLQWERGVATVAQDFQTIDLALQACEQSASGDVTPAWWGRGSGQRSKALAEARLALALDSLRGHFASVERQLDKCSGLSDEDITQHNTHASSAAHALRVALDAARSQLLAAGCLPGGPDNSTTADAQAVAATLARFGVVSTQECSEKINQARWCTVELLLRPAASLLRALGFSDASSFISDGAVLRD